MVESKYAGLDRRDCKTACTETAILREKIRTYTIVGGAALALSIGIVGWFDHRFNAVETKMDNLRKEIVDNNGQVHDDINSFRNRLNAHGL